MGRDAGMARAFLDALVSEREASDDAVVHPYGPGTAAGTLPRSGASSHTWCRERIARLG